LKPPLARLRRAVSPKVMLARAARAARDRGRPGRRGAVQGVVRPLRGDPFAASSRGFHGNLKLRVESGPVSMETRTGVAVALRSLGERVGKLSSTLNSILQGIDVMLGR